MKEELIQTGSVTYINGFKWVKSEPDFKGQTIEGVDDNGKKIVLQLTNGLEEVALGSGRIAVIDNKNLTFAHSYCYRKYKGDLRAQRYTVCGLRDGDVIKIGYAVCRLDEQFIKAVGRNEAAKNAITSTWTVPVLNENPKLVRETLYNAMQLIERHFNLFKSKLSKSKEETFFEIPSTGILSLSGTSSSTTYTQEYPSIGE